MRKEFDRVYMTRHKGCYEMDKLNACSFMGKPIISILDILNSEISIKDKAWFLLRKCDLTLNQKKALALTLAKSVVGIYNKKYPNDTRVSDCLTAIDLFNSGKISISELREKRAAAYAAAAYAAYAAADAAADAYAAYAAAYAAYAAADAAAYAADAYAADAYAADADAAAADAAYAAAYAADAADAYAYKKFVLKILIDFVESN